MTLTREQLREELRAQSVTYAQLAAEVNRSHAWVKKVFEGRLPLTPWAETEILAALARIERERNRRPLMRLARAACGLKT